MFEDLCDLVVLEQFKKAVPNRIATYIAEQQVKTVGEAAALADLYILTTARIGELCMLLLALWITRGGAQAPRGQLDLCDRYAVPRESVSFLSCNASHLRRKTNH